MAPLLGHLQGFVQQSVETLVAILDQSLDAIPNHLGAPVQLSVVRLQGIILEQQQLAHRLASKLEQGVIEPQNVVPQDPHEKV
ncbi:MAG: hypothetical protein OXP66_19700 [Candidatus Tectomicrobia bacterium]|nr:hypothetical protein [Candidatus Tectomicrobia bacterium]